MSSRGPAISIIFLPLVVDVLEIKSMDMSRDISQQRKKDIDTEVNTTSGNQEDTKRGNEDLLLLVRYR
jgi:hypothetical protein